MRSCCVCADEAAGTDEAAVIGYTSSLSEGEHSRHTVCISYECLICIIQLYVLHKAVTRLRDSLHVHLHVLPIECIKDFLYES